MLFLAAIAGISIFFGVIFLALFPPPMWPVVAMIGTSAVMTISVAFVSGMTGALGCMASLTLILALCKGGYHTMKGIINLLANGMSQHAQNEQPDLSSTSLSQTGKIEVAKKPVVILVNSNKQQPETTVNIFYPSNTEGFKERPKESGGQQNIVADPAVIRYQ